MKNIIRLFAAAGAASALLVAVPATAQQLIVNGGFEESSSPTLTPTGWTNVGHSDGVIAYAVYNTPAYDGDYFYDFGGFGDSSGPAGDGIEQTVATAIGSIYTLTFGISDEDYAGTSVLQILFNGVEGSSYTLTSEGLEFQRPFVTTSVNYVATSTATTITFLEGVGTGSGNGYNDPLIDKVSFQTADVSAAPEAATWALMMFGIAGIGAAMRRRYSNRDLCTPRSVLA